MKNLWLTKSEFKAAAPAVLRGTLLGCMLGILPGGGALLSSFAAYSLEKKISKNHAQFGKGAIEGVAAPEAANNAGAQTSFIPLLTLGIPSNPVMALMIGAMMIHNIQPGPQIVINQPQLFWGMIASMWIGNLMLVIFNLPLIGMWVRLLSVPYRLLFPSILLFCGIGIYSLSYNTFDIHIAALFGLLGYIFVKLECEPAPLMLGFILGPMLEEYLRRAMLLSRGDPTHLRYESDLGRHADRLGHSAGYRHSAHGAQEARRRFCGVIKKKTSNPSTKGERQMVKIVSKCLILFAAMAFTFTGAFAQDYPTQPIRIIVPYTAGGSSDYVGRTVGAKLQENLGRPVVVENRPGGNAVIGTELVAKARPDGYTLLCGGDSRCLRRTWPCTRIFPMTRSEILPRSPTSQDSQIVVAVNPKVPVNSIKELIAYAKANPGKLNYGSAGVGNTLHLAGRNVLPDHRHKNDSHSVQRRFPGAHRFIGRQHSVDVRPAADSFVQYPGRKAEGARRHGRETP